MRINQPRRKSGQEATGRTSREVRPCRFLSPEEFADLRARNDWDEIERRYVRHQAGRPKSDSAKTAAERMRAYRQRKRDR